MTATQPKILEAPVPNLEILLLLRDLAPYIHDLNEGFLEPKTQAAGYTGKEIDHLNTRLQHAIKELCK